MTIVTVLRLGSMPFRTLQKMSINAYSDTNQKWWKVWKLMLWPSMLRILPTKSIGEDRVQCHLSRTKGNVDHAGPSQRQVPLKVLTLFRLGTWTISLSRTWLTVMLSAMVAAVVSWCMASNMPNRVLSCLRLTTLTLLSMDLATMIKPEDTVKSLHIQALLVVTPLNLKLPSWRVQYLSLSRQTIMFSRDTLLVSSPVDVVTSLTTVSSLLDMAQRLVKITSSSRTLGALHGVTLVMSRLHLTSVALPKTQPSHTTTENFTLENHI